MSPKLEKAGRMAGLLMGILVFASAVIGGSYTIATGMGLIVSEARAGEIAQAKVEPEELARLEYVLETKRATLRKLNRIDQPTPDDRQEISDLQDDIKRVRDRIEEIKEQGVT